MNEEWFWRWLFLKWAESYFTWFWERYGRSWRDDSYTELIKLYVWCYVMVLQLMESFETPDQEELPTVSREDRAELEVLRESFRRQMPTYDPFAAALSRIQVNTTRQIQASFKDMQFDPLRQLQASFQDMQKLAVRQLQASFQDKQLESIRRLDRFRDL
jgi:hypothetical protein